MREYAVKMLKALKSPALGMIWRASAGKRKHLLALSLLQALSAILSLGFTLLMKELVDAAVGSNGQRLTRLVLMLTGMTLVIILIGYLRSILGMKIRTGLLKTMRMDAIHRLMGKQYASLQSFHSGELVNRVFSDVSIVVNGVINIVPPLLYLLIQLVGAAVILYRLNSGFMLILLVAGALSTIITFAFRNKMKAFHKETQTAEDKFHARVQETLENLRIIKASGTDARMEREIGFFQSAYTDAQIRHARFSALMGTGLGLFFRASWFYAFLWGCAGVYRGDFTFGMLTAILQLVGQIQSPFGGLISTMSTVFGSVSSAERLMEFYEMPDEAPDPNVKQEELQSFQSVSLENLCFSYPGKASVLRGIDLSIHAGDMMAIMGESGCGKSTLFSILLGLYPPYTGTYRIQLQNRKIEGALRGLYAYVPQGNALFSGTLRENIAMFCDREVSDEEVMRAAQLACIDDLIAQVGMEAMLGERGIGLSEGQAQRIAIARALMTDHPILLLDEATSALDEQTEARLLKNIAGLKEKTCLIVTHRRAALEICGCAYVLRDGFLIENDSIVWK